MANRYEFITESIMSSSSAMLRDDFDLQGCECIGECNEDCTCLEMSHSSRTYFQSKGSSILLSDANYPIFECSSNCSCHCTTNRSYQCPNITVFDTHKTGFGLKATSEIKKGTVISEYIGIILSEEEAAKEAKSSSDTEFYLMTINEHFSSGVMRTHISAKKEGKSIKVYKPLLFTELLQNYYSKRVNNASSSHCSFQNNC
eukprot:TRINITY_DN10057_c0_g1_i1.p1 TRINITY_DN10057_c0_g1~~TRINITY_DN10057_c0_g1_i1.p1  ORF type:complete len:201 (-),score=9.84 TRINITY_DN10057_c0_g1_i1:130-732(-)